jgi:hypothetical protein
MADSHMNYARAIVQDHNAHPGCTYLEDDIADAIRTAMEVERTKLVSLVERMGYHAIAADLLEYALAQMPEFDADIDEDDDWSDDDDQSA